MEVVATEFALCHSFGKRNVGGVIDIIFQTSDDNFIIVDNKSGSLPGTKKQREEFCRWVFQVNEVLTVSHPLFTVVFRASYSLNHQTMFLPNIACKCPSTAIFYVTRFLIAACAVYI